MTQNNSYDDKARAMIPAVLQTDNKEVFLNVEKAVSVEPVVEETIRNNNYPIIIIPGVMGSRLFDKGYNQIWPPAVKPIAEFSGWTVAQVDKLKISKTLYTHDYRVEQRTKKR